MPGHPRPFSRRGRRWGRPRINKRKRIFKLLREVDKRKN